MTDLFIKKPILALVISALIFLFGLQSLFTLTVRQYPELINTVITVTTVYPGADAGLIKGFITAPMQRAVASAQGVEYVTATSSQNISVVKAHITLGYDPNDAITQVMAKVAEVRGELPSEAQEPVINQETGDTIALMYMSFYSEILSSQQITDYLLRVVQPQLETLSGVAQAEILGGQTFAIRIWLDPNRLAAFNLSATDVARALQANNYLAAIGNTKSNAQAIAIRINTDLQDPEAFQDLVIKSDGTRLVRLADVATVELGSESYDSTVIFNGKKATFIGIKGTAEANPVTVIENVRAALPALEKELPKGLEMKVVYDGTLYIKEAIKEVIKTLIEALVIVVLVILVFLGSLRTTLIPALTIPLSLVGAATLMLMMGFSLNLLTLLALVLAIGLVVDDAIIVVENVYRHIEEGMQPFDAAIKGARELLMPIISMTLTLVAVFVPIGFIGGITGTLFIEFAYTLAAAVVISGVVALTLSPMMASRLLLPHNQSGGLVHFIDQQFSRLEKSYQQSLHKSLNHQASVALVALAALVSIYFLYTSTQNELAPTEDQGILFSIATGPNTATADYMYAYSTLMNTAYESFPETSDYFIINGLGSVNTTIAGMIFKPWEERERSQAQVLPELDAALASIPGFQTVTFPLPALPGGGTGLPIEFVLVSNADYLLLDALKDELVQKANQSGLFIFLDSDLRLDKPQWKIAVNREKAASLGLSMQDIGNALAVALGGNYINRFNFSERAYEVIPDTTREYRQFPEAIANYQLPLPQGGSLPLSSLISVDQEVTPNTLYQFQQLNSVTLQGVMRPGVSLGEALAYLQREAEKTLPPGVRIDYAGQSRQLMTEGNKLLFAFVFAILVIYLALAAQFESLRDPLIILISVPMSIFGALLFLSLGLGTINIYTQIGLVTLIGLISKHGILMVEFANRLQEAGHNKREAIEMAASIRLRPILMTTAATVLGVLPLLLADGPGAAARFAMGLVIASGMTVGTLFTLFVLPTVYLWLGKKRAVLT
jgi:multidrug efflux pump